MRQICIRVKQMVPWCVYFTNWERGETVLTAEGTKPCSYSSTSRAVRSLPDILPRRRWRTNRKKWFSLQTHTWNRWHVKHPGVGVVFRIIAFLPAPSSYEPKLSFRIQWSVEIWTPRSVLALMPNRILKSSLWVSLTIYFTVVVLGGGVFPYYFCISWAFGSLLEKDFGCVPRTSARLLQFAVVAR